MKNKSLWILTGLLLLIFGFTAIVLQLVGVSWAFLHFLDQIGGLFAFVMKVLMVMAGILLIVIARTDWEQEKQRTLEDEE